MADTRFFTKHAPMRLGDIAALAGGMLSDTASADRMISDVAPLDIAVEGQLSFLDNPRYKDQFSASKAAACIVAPQMVVHAPAGTALIVTSNPYKSYALVAQAFYPDSYPAAAISPGAYIDPAAEIGAGCVIEAGAIVKADAKIGPGCWIESGAVIGAGVVLGPKCRIGATSTVSHAVLGEAVRLYPGVRVGQDGFGFAIDPAGHVKVPQLGRVIIEDHVEVGSNTCIDRGSGPDTVIGAGTWIDNLVQIGHNVKIGRGCILIAHSGVAGSSVLEDYVVLAAQAGIAGHLRIGKGARIGAQSGVMKDIPAGDEQIGSPAMPAKDFMRQVVMLKRLTKYKKGE